MKFYPLADYISFLLRYSILGHFCCAVDSIKDFGTFYNIKTHTELFIAIWILIDIVLDVRQTFVYYTHAFYEEGPYFQWTEQENRLMNRSSDAPKQLASVYFYTASVVWGLPPLLMGFAIILMAFYDLKVFGRSISRWVLLFFPLCLLYTSPSPRDRTRSRMPSSA